MGVAIWASPRVYPANLCGKWTASHLQQNGHITMLDIFFFLNKLIDFQPRYLGHLFFQSFFSFTVGLVWVGLHGHKIREH